MQGGTSIVWMDLDFVAKREREMTGKTVDPVVKNRRKYRVTHST